MLSRLLFCICRLEYLWAMPCWLVYMAIRRFALYFMPCRQVLGYSGSKVFAGMLDMCSRDCFPVWVHFVPNLHDREIHQCPRPECMCGLLGRLFLGLSRRIRMHNLPCRLLRRIHWFQHMHPVSARLNVAECRQRELAGSM